MHDLKFSDDSHCHWSYRLGRYESFLNWLTEADLREYLVGRPDEFTVEPFIRHSRTCTCDKDIEA